MRLKLNHAFNFLSITLINSFATKDLIKHNEQYEYGESDAQFNSRKQLTKECQSLYNIKPEDFNINEFSNTEQIDIYFSKMSCNQAEKYHESMKKTMVERRTSNRGDQTYFGPRNRIAIYKDQYINQDNEKTIKAHSPLLQDIEQLKREINKRASQNFR